MENKRYSTNDVHKGSQLQILLAHFLLYSSFTVFCYYLLSLCSENIPLLQMNRPFLTVFHFKISAILWYQLMFLTTHKFQLLSIKQLSFLYFLKFSYILNILLNLSTQMSFHLAVHFFKSLGLSKMSVITDFVFHFGKKTGFRSKLTIDVIEHLLFLVKVIHPVRN